MDLSRTIVAIGSGLAPSRRAIVRISGPETRSILDKLFSCSEQDLATKLVSKSAVQFEAQCNIQLRSGSRLNSELKAPSGSQSLTSKRSSSASLSKLDVSCYWWPNDRCYTGEPSAELHLLGSLPLAEALVERVVSLGAHPANRGEFTLRSFLAGKVDLAQAEAVLGVIESDNEFDLSSALAQLGGNLSKPVRQLRDQLLEMTAHLEAGLDFVEEDIEFISAEQLTNDLNRIGKRIDEILKGLQLRSTRSRDLSVLLVGPPNAGKSTLFNAMLGDARTIVSDQAGTTRDAVTSNATVGPFEIALTDTAGIEQVTGLSPRALAQTSLASFLAKADVVIACHEVFRDLSQARWLSELRGQAEPNLGSRLMVVGTKLDIAEKQALRYSESASDFAIQLSAYDAQAVERLKLLVAQRLEESQQRQQSTAMHDATVRSKHVLELAANSIHQALELVETRAGEELVAAELRIAINDMSAVIGEVHTEDLLGQIFSRFCIGK